MNRRRKRRLPFAVYAALIFNMAICLAPFIGARALSTAYGDKRPAFEATSEALAATRRAMDVRFAELAKNGDGNRRDVWANYVRGELETGNMTAVRGFLLGAAAMLDGADGDALKARIAVSNTSGEQALLDAAVAYLPEDVQDEYERSSASLIARFDATAPASALPGAETPASFSPVAPAQASGDRIRYRVLGDLRDLSITAARWARQDNTDEFAFILAGVGLILADPEAQEGASIALSARRGQQLDPSFEAYLERKLFLAAPPQRIKRLLEGEFQSEYGYGTTGPAVVESVFKSSVDRVALESVLADFRILRDIARDTSAQSAVAILSRVKDGSDLQRARLVAQAGGDRAVPLALYDGDRLLDTARTVITWNNALRLQVAGLIACLGLLAFVAMSTLVKSFTRDMPKKRSAVYQMDEYPA
jgi:hypothetical protein